MNFSHARFLFADFSLLKRRAAKDYLYGIKTLSVEEFGHSKIRRGMTGTREIEAKVSTLKAAKVEFLRSKGGDFWFSQTSGAG